MLSYLELLQEVRHKGVRQKNRTGVDTFMIPGGMMQFNLSEGFPILTTKKVNFTAVKGELVGFLLGADNAASFRAFGTSIWDANANDNKQWLASPHRRGPDDLGRIYGVQWRKWRGVTADTAGMFELSEIDQLRGVVNTIIRDPESRRIVMTAWNPAELHRMALPPCHLLCQFLVEQEAHRLNMCMYMRSCDMFLGVPFNISSYALLLEIVARATGYVAGRLTMFLADCHIYENHLQQVDEQLARSPRVLPGVSMPVLNGVEPLEWIESLRPSEIQLGGYDPHPPIKASMAV